MDKKNQRLDPLKWFKDKIYKLIKKALVLTNKMVQKKTIRASKSC